MNFNFLFDWCWLMLEKNSQKVVFWSVSAKILPTVLIGSFKKTFLLFLQDLL